MSGLLAFAFWRDVVIPLALVIAAPIAGFTWTWWQESRRRHRFLRLIRRELEEVSPSPWPPMPGRGWWEHQEKRFVHRQILSDVTANRDFVLDLHPAVVYQLTQLWDAFDAREGREWVYFLECLARGPAGSDALRMAIPRWRELVAKSPAEPASPPSAESFADLPARG